LVAEDQPISLSELAEKLTCVRPNVTQLVDRLEADGLMKRTDDPVDRRGGRAEVTKLGRERHTAGLKVVNKVHEAVARQLSAVDQSALKRALDTTLNFSNQSFIYECCSNETKRKEYKNENILLIQSSPRGLQSYSQKVARSVVSDLDERYPDAKLVVRDLARKPRLPPVIMAIFWFLFSGDLLAMRYSFAFRSN
jgi:DNA-binding MarR family transcriptional regulator